MAVILAPIAFSNSQVNLNQGSPLSLLDDVEIHYDGDNNGGIGLPQANFIIAARFTTVQTQEHIGKYIKKIRIYVFNPTFSNNATLRIYQQGTSTAPGAQIYYQWFSTVPDSWNEIVLDNPILVPSSDIWVAIQAAGSISSPNWAGYDSGPNHPDGQWIFVDGSWYRVTDLEPDLTYNWNIRVAVGELNGPALNGPTPWEIIGNTFSQPNITKQIGLGDLEWYGSGDVNLDGKVDSLDLQSMNQGVQNNMSDIDGDGIKSTANDKSVLSAYLSGLRDYLPGDWNELKTPEERVSWFSKMRILTDGLNGLPPGWVCSHYINQMNLDFYGLSNYEEAFNLGIIDPQTNIDSVAKFNLPMYYFSTTTTNGVGHAVSGVLVGRRINPDSISLNPLEFRDWYFVNYWNDTMRVYPGNSYDMSPNHPVSMKKFAYIRSGSPPPLNEPLFTSLGPFISWNLDNGNATLDTSQSYYLNWLVLENPNFITVYVGGLDDLVINGGNVLLSQTSLTPDILEVIGYNGVPDTTKENTVLPINITYRGRDTTWSADSTSFSFNRDFYAWIYSGGVTKSDSTRQNIKVENLIGPSTAVHVSGLDSIILDVSQIPPGQNLTPEFLESLGYNAIPDTSKENTNLPINLFYIDRQTVWSLDSTSNSFNRDFYASLYSFGETLIDSSRQNIKVANITSVRSNESILPDKYTVHQNYPNPFNPITSIKYELPEASDISLKIYDILGSEVTTLVDEQKDVGYYSIEFSTNGYDIASGIYFYRLEAKSKVSEKHFTKVGKMILMK